MDNKEVINIIPSKDISFKTRSLLSQILSRLELSNQDRLDLEKYITFGGGENLDYVKDNLEDFVKWKDKVLNIIKDAPEEFDTLIEIFNYIEQHIQDAPFEKGEAENSAVLKGEYQDYLNKAISRMSTAVGAGTTAGLKGYYISYANAMIIYISEVNTELLDSEPSIDNNFINPYEVGDIYSVHYGTNHYNVGKIISINHNKITVDAAIVPTKDAELRYHFYVFDKADKGVVDIGECAYAEGIENKAYNVAAHAEGYGNKSLGKYSHTEGKQNEAHYCAHAEGSNNKSIGNTSHTEGTDNIASNSNAHAEGRYTTASGYGSHAEGYGENINNRTVASGDGSHAEGRFTEASGKYSHSEGEKTKAIGLAAHAEGLQTVAEGQASHAEGRYTYAKGVQSHAEGYGKQDGSTGAFGAYSHSEGQYTIASGPKSHSEGTETNASADSAHAEGLRTAANGMYSHAEGRNTITNNDAEHASGKYNVSIPKTAENTTAEATLFSIGVGTSNNDRKNAFEVKQNGDTYLCIGGTLYFVTPITDDELNELFND